MFPIGNLALAEASSSEEISLSGTWRCLKATPARNLPFIPFTLNPYEFGADHESLADTGRNRCFEKLGVAFANGEHDPGSH
jgi:hypothetical protein